MLGRMNETLEDKCSTFIEVALSGSHSLPVQISKITTMIVQIYFLPYVSFLRKVICFLLFIYCCIIPELLFSQSQIKIRSDLPGGNIKVERVTSDTVFLQPDLRDTEGDWFYWYFAVNGGAGKDIVFQFDRPTRLAAFGPAISIDQGETWKWLYSEPTKDKDMDRFSYSFPSTEKEIRFSMRMPYIETNLSAFLETHKSPLLQVDTLCITPKGRAVERLSIGSPGTEAPKYKVLLTARHHACEMIANYLLEGIIDALLSSDDSLDWLRENVEFMIIPFMDKDGVEDGDQGKNRAPRDHNRDYSDASIYNTTAALRETVPEWAEGKMRIGLDLHCPYIKGDGHENIHILGKGSKKGDAEIRKFAKILERNNNGELTFGAESDFLAFGTSWNTPSNTTQGMSFSQWAATIDNISLATTIEFPYAISHGQMITPSSARLFGNDVAHAIAVYLQELNRNE